MLTKEQVQEISSIIHQHPDTDGIFDMLWDAVSGEISVTAPRILEAYIKQDVDLMINAFTGWDLQALLEKALIIPHTSGSWIGHDLDQDEVIVKTIPGAEEEYPFASEESDFPSFKMGTQSMDDYAFEMCPECGEEVVIYAHGISTCPACGAAVAPCSNCEKNGGTAMTCINGCNGNHVATNPMISKAEIAWAKQAYNDWLEEIRLKGEPSEADSYGPEIDE